MHHQAGVNFENFTEVNFRNILITGTGRPDRRLKQNSPGQTGTCGRSSLNQNLKPKPNFRFIRERPFAIPSFQEFFDASGKALRTIVSIYDTAQKNCNASVIEPDSL